MKAITIWQPWASLIVHGLKPAEFRNWHFPKRMIGERIVIHAGAPAPKKHILHLLSDDENIIGSCGPTCDVARIRELLERCADRGYRMTTKAGVGTVKLGVPERADNYYRRRGWKLGGEGPWNIAWPMTLPEAWPEPVPMTGSPKFWDWPETLP